MWAFSVVRSWDGGGGGRFPGPRNWRHEALQLGVGEGGMGAVVGQDPGRRALGRGVDEGLAVREQLRICTWWNRSP
jgi:hypothetical protein